MIFLKTDDEIELLRQSNLLVGRTLAEVAKMIKPGVTTKQLDKVAEEFIRDHGAVPTFKGFPNPYGGPFPGSICASVNEQVVHGIPNDIPLKEGDIISVDCGTYMNGFCGDSAYTFCVGEVAPEILELLKTTKEALYVILGMPFSSIVKLILMVWYVNLSVMVLVKKCMKTLKCLTMESEEQERC